MDLGPRRIALVAVTLAALPLGASVVGAFVSVSPVGLLVAALSTAGLSAAAVVGSSQRPDAFDGTAALVGACIVFGWLEVPLAYGLITGVGGLHDLPPADGGGIVGALVAGLLVGTVPGFLFSLLYAIPVGLARSLAGRRSHEATDRALLWCGTWLGLVGAGLALVAPPMLRPGLAAHDATVQLVHTALCVGVAVLGLATALAGAVRLHRRIRLLRRVALGLEPGWVVLPLASVPGAPPEVPPLFHRTVDPSGVLLRRHEPRAGAYRSAETLEPWALV